MDKLFGWLKRIYDKYKFALYSSFILSFLTHLYFFTKRLGNEDDLNHLSFAFRSLGSGRWSTGTFFTGNFVLPIVNFVLILIVLAIVTVIICDLLKLKSKKSMFFVSALISSFPSLAMSFSYVFMIEIYMLALLFAVLAVYVTSKFKYGFVFGGILAGCSLGHYQSYLGIASALSIVYLIKMVIDKADSKNVITMAIKLFAMGIIGTIVYFLILKIYLNIFDVSLSGYKGSDKMGIPPLEMWPNLIKRTYLHFIGYFLGMTFVVSSKAFVIIKIILIVLCAYLLAYIVVQEKIYKNKFNLILLIFFVMFAPLAINIIDFMAYSTQLSVLNIYQFVIAYVLVVYIFDKYFDLYKKKNKMNDIIYVTVTFLILSIFWQNFTITNRYYLKNEEFYEYTYALNNRLLSRIENTEGFDYDMPVLITASDESKFKEILFDNYYWKDIFFYDQALWGRFIGYEDLYYFSNDKKIIRYLNNMLGFDLKEIEDDEKTAIIESNDYKDIGSWPAKDCIKIIDGILVVNF